MNHSPRKAKSFPLLALACSILLMAGCVTTSPSKPTATTVGVQKAQDQVYGGIKLVTARQGDTLASLAARNLSDSKKAWLISDLNGIKTITPGQVVVIPPADYRLGGIYPSGYQVVPILTYHNFSKKKVAKMIVPQAKFEAQMKFLKQNGYQTITLDELFDFIDFKGTIPPKSVVITVDDGWRPFYDIAYPILKKYGFRATLFLYTDFVGGRKAVSWKQVKEMAANGIEIHNHTKSHRNLAKQKKGESFKAYFKTLQKEIVTGESKLKKNANIDSRYLAYPYGETNDLVVELLKKRGYRAAFTVKRGSNPFYIDNYRINRTVIYGDYTLKKFAANLAVFKRK